MYTVEAIPAPELGNASFLVADTDHGVGLVVDPLRDIERYLHVATNLNVKLTHALDTHLHNDYVSGCRELAADVGANVSALEVGADLEIGGITIRAIHTPGHTPDHKAYLLGEGGRHRALFSGGAVMLGAIARTDLFGPHLAVHLALEALSTLQVRLRGLPDDIAVFPTHGGGSFCGTGGRSGHETTLGQERKTNPFFLTTEVMPFLARALNQHRYPTYYRDMGAINRGGATLIGKSVPPLAALTADEVARMMDDGAAVVDVRIGRDYDRGHIPGSYNVGIDGPVSAWVGWLIARGRPLILVGGGDKELHKAQRQLLRIGYDTIAGGLDGGIEAWQSSGREVSTFETIDVEDMAQWVLSAEPMTVVDTRDEHEWVAGHVPGAVHMYVPDVPHRADEIPRDAPVAVHCASGYRAGIAASLLEQAGLKRIIHVNGDRLSGGDRGEPARAGGAEADHPRERRIQRLGPPPPGGVCPELGEAQLFPACAEVPPEGRGGADPAMSSWPGGGQPAHPAVSGSSWPARSPPTATGCPIQPSRIGNRDGPPRPPLRTARESPARRIRPGAGSGTAPSG